MTKTGGEIQLYGYFVDGYDKERNIIFEYDEKKHYKSNGNLNNKDIYRQNLIIERYQPKSIFSLRRRKTKSI